MAGITALYIKKQQPFGGSGLIRRVLDSSFPPSRTQCLSVPLDHDSVALGASFPKHFERKNAYAIRPPRTMLFYGELYNDLMGKDEAEFALTRLSQNGLSWLCNLNGPFTFIVWDEQTKELIAVTDRLGRFPLFYFITDDYIAITTDLDACFSAGLYRASLLHESVIDLLTVGFALGEKTMFEGVRRASGGTYLVISPRGIVQHSYWQPRLRHSNEAIEHMVNMFEVCTIRAVRRCPECAATLSGGWDSRATWAVLGKSPHQVSAVTYGEATSADVSIASTVSRFRSAPHIVLQAGEDFFKSFDTLARETIIRGNGHLTIDLAFQLYVYQRIAEHFPIMVDSAGCEMRRGIRAKHAARRSRQTSDITEFLLSIYQTGVWNETMLSHSLGCRTEDSTFFRLTEWLEQLGAASGEEQIDAFSFAELWSHSYAYGYPFQTSVIACRMPYTDNEMYDLYLTAGDFVRWSHKFQDAVIQRFAPELKHVPISHGGITVPYGESYRRYLPLLYHEGLMRLEKVLHARWPLRLDNSKPFRPLHQWYRGELKAYVREMLFSGSIEKSGLINMNNVENVLRHQRETMADHSRPISILLTLAHLLDYVRNLQSRP